MPTPPSTFPDTGTLAAGLGKIFARAGSRGNPPVVVAREPMIPAMTFPTEIVTCRLAGRKKLRLFCKHEARRNHNAYGHRGGLALEAEVYRRVLRPLRLTTPKFFGTLGEEA